MAFIPPPLIPTTPKQPIPGRKIPKTKVLVVPTIESESATTGSPTKRMSVTLEDGMVVIRMPLQTTPAISSTGKSKLYCTTRGPRRVVQKTKDNTYMPVEFDGGVLKAIASAFVTLAPANSANNTRTVIKRKKKQ